MKKKLVVLTLCGMMAMSAVTVQMAGTVFAADRPETSVIAAQEGEQIPNPWQDYTSVKDAIQAIDGEILQVFYKNGKKELLIRKAFVSQGKDISGVYNTYDVTQKVSVKGKKGKVTVKGTKEKKYLATWNDGTYSYSIYTSAGMSKNRIDYNRIRQTDELEETLVAEKREDLRFVWEAVRALPDKYREVIHLFHYEGCTTAEIARILDCKEATVRTNLRRGRQQLKEILKEEYDFAEV